MERVRSGTCGSGSYLRPSGCRRKMINNRVSNWWKLPPIRCVLGTRVLYKHDWVQHGSHRGRGWIGSLQQCINDHANDSLQEEGKSSLKRSSPSSTPLLHFLPALCHTIAASKMTAVGKSELHTLNSPSRSTPTGGNDTAHTTIKDFFFHVRSPFCTALTLPCR